MELSGGFDPEFTVDSEIMELQKEVDQHDGFLADLKKAFEERQQELSDRIRRLQEIRYEEEQKYVSKVQKSRIDHAAKRTRLDALKKEKKLQEEKQKIEDVIVIIKELMEDDDAWKAAREYQVEDIVQIVQQYLAGASGVLNGNEMALGKTFEALVALKILTKLFEKKHNRLPRTLWLTKLSILLTGGTVNEAKRWYPELKIFPVKGAETKVVMDMVFEMAEKGGICVLTNYETVKKLSGKNLHWDFVITDEVHKLKGGANPGKPTDIWKAVKELNIGFHLMLSGTPMVNRVEEMWSYLHLFDPLAFPKSGEFARSFRALRKIGGGLQLDMSSEKLLHQILKGRFIRRTAAEVGLQLPPVTWIEHVLQHGPEQGKLYQQMREQFFIWLDGIDDNKILPANGYLPQLIRLRQINVLPVATFNIKNEEGDIVDTVHLDVRDSSKIDELVDIMMELGDQAIVFCTFNEPLEEAAKRLQEWGFTTAIISSKYSDKMDTYEVDFQQKKIDVLLINSAMGEGLNLHKDSTKWPGGARAVILLDKWYSPARNEQCVKRAVRPGTNEPVFVHNLTVENSVDLFIQALNDEKSELFSIFTENSVARPAGELKKLLRKLL